MTKESNEPTPPEVLNAGRYAERLWGYKDQVGSYEKMGMLYERDRADFWYARFKEVTAVEPTDAPADLWTCDECAGPPRPYDQVQCVMGNCKPVRTETL